MRLGEIKANSKALNKQQHSPKNKPEFSQAFMVAAELLLSEEQYLELEIKAAQIVENLK